MRTLETRRASTREARVEPSEGDRPAYLVGYAAVFESNSGTLCDDDGNPFVEVITPGAFGDLAALDVRAFQNHDESRLLGRTRSRTLELWEDENGLGYRCAMPDVSYAHDLVVLVGREDLDGCSFGFTVPEGGDEFTLGEDGIPIRRLNRVDLVEVSFGVVFPAYPATSVSVRSLKLAARIPAPEVPGVRSRNRHAARRRQIESL